MASPRRQSRRERCTVPGCPNGGVIYEGDDWLAVGSRKAAHLACAEEDLRRHCDAIMGRAGRNAGASRRLAERITAAARHSSTVLDYTDTGSLIIDYTVIVADRRRAPPAN